MKKQNRLILIDGSGYIFRAYYALPPMSRKDGTPINKGFLMKDNVKQKKTEKKKDSIKQKALDLVNEKRFDKRDGVYYYKGSDIKVDAKVLE